MSSLISPADSFLYWFCLVYVGIYNTAAHAAPDKKLRRDLRVNIENNMKLLRSIASSQDRLEVEKNVKELMTLSTHLQKEEKQPDLTQNEIRDIVNDVILELKKTQKKS
jgi:DNA-binding transcriptional regulator GbsR (MarR family)